MLGQLSIESAATGRRNETMNHLAEDSLIPQLFDWLGISRSQNGQRSRSFNNMPSSVEKDVFGSIFDAIIEDCSVDAMSYMAGMAIRFRDNFSVRMFWCCVPAERNLRLSNSISIHLQQSWHWICNLRGLHKQTKIVLRCLSNCHILPVYLIQLFI